MFRHRNSLHGLLTIAVVLALLMLVAPAATAQAQPAPKAEIFAGYSWLDPNGSIPYLYGGCSTFTTPGVEKPLATPQAQCPPINLGSQKIPTLPYGWGAAFAYYFKPWVGLVADASGHYGQHNAIHTFMFGPQFKWRTERLAVFGEAFAGLANISPANPPPTPPPTPTSFPSMSSFAVGGGGGLDLTIVEHIAIRLFQADYIYTNYKDKTGPFPAQNDHLNMVRIQAGLVFLLGQPEEKPLSLVCSANPTPVFAGEPVTITSTATNPMPKRILTYSFTGNGFKLTPKGNIAGVDTTGLAPGDYPVNCGVVDNGKGKQQRTASAKTMFTVKEMPKHPPVATCQISASQVMKGDPVKVSVSGTNPDNRPLSYSCNASSGRLSGSGTSYMLDTTTTSGTVKVNCMVRDDRGLSGSCSTSVYVNVPKPLPPPEVNAIDFYTCKQTPKHLLGAARVDNCAKAILDDVALRLQRNADATLAIVGYASVDELKLKKNVNLAGQRAHNTKMYLVKEKGIDPGRISLYTAKGEEKAELYIVTPQTLKFNPAAIGATPFDDSKMMPVTKKAAPAKKPVAKATKPAAKATK